MRLGLLIGRNDLEIGGLGDCLPDESDYSTAVRVRNGVGVIGGRGILAWIKGMDGDFGLGWGDGVMAWMEGIYRMGIPACAGMTVGGDGMTVWGLDSGLRRNDGWGLE